MHIERSLHRGVLPSDLFEVLLEIYTCVKWEKIGDRSGEKSDHCQSRTGDRKGEKCVHLVAVCKSFFLSPKLGTESRIRIPRWSLAWRRSHLLRTVKIES